MDWVRMDQYRTGCWVFMKLAMNLRVQLETVNLLTGKEAFQEILLHSVDSLVRSFMQNTLPNNST